MNSFLSAYPHIDVGIPKDLCVVIALLTLCTFLQKILYTAVASYWIEQYPPKFHVDLECMNDLIWENRVLTDVIKLICSHPGLRWVLIPIYLVSVLEEERHRNRQHRGDHYVKRHKRKPLIIPLNEGNCGQPPGISCTSCVHRRKMVVWLEAEFGQCSCNPGSSVDLGCYHRTPSTGLLTVDNRNWFLTFLEAGRL